MRLMRPRTMSALSLSRLSLLFLLLSVPCEAAISRVSCTDVAGDSIAGTTTQVGDVFIVSGWRDDSNTAITQPMGFTQMLAETGDTSAIAVAYKYASGTSTDTDTWTGAQAITVCVYRGANASDPIGDCSINEGTSTTTETWNALTLQVTDGSSWVVAAVGNRGNTAADFGEDPGTLITVTSEQTGGASGMAWADSNGGVSSYAGDTVTVTTSQSNKTATCELLAATASGDTRRSRMNTLGVGR